MQEAAIITIVDLTAAAAAQADPRSPADAATWPLLAPHVELLRRRFPRRVHAQPAPGHGEGLRAPDSHSWRSLSRLAATLEPRLAGGRAF